MPAESCVGCGHDYVGSGSGKWRKDDLIPLPPKHACAPGKVCPDCYEELGLTEEDYAESGMTREELEDFFDAHDGEAMKHERIPVERRLHPGRDVNALMILSKYADKPGGLICSAEHDQIWFNVDLGTLAKATEEDLVDLIRCGVWLDEFGPSMFI